MHVFISMLSYHVYTMQLKISHTTYIYFFTLGNTMLLPAITTLSNRIMHSFNTTVYVKQSDIMSYVNANHLFTTKSFN